MKIFSEYIDDRSDVLAIGDIVWINLSEEDVLKKHNNDLIFLEKYGCPEH